MINSMISDQERVEFSARLNALMAARGIAPRARTTKLQKWTGMSKEGCRKWLKEMAIPSKRNIRVISSKLSCRQEWLEYGVEPMDPLGAGPDQDEVEEFLEAARKQLAEASPEDRRDLTRVLLLILKRNPQGS